MIEKDVWRVYESHSAYYVARGVGIWPYYARWDGLSASRMDVETLRGTEKGLQFLNTTEYGTYFLGLKDAESLANNLNGDDDLWE